MASLSLKYFRFNGTITADDIVGPDDIKESRMQLKSNLFEHKLIGFNNNGAICWWNTLLQVMLRCDAFNSVAWLYQDENKTMVANVYTEIINAMKNGKQMRSDMSGILLSAFAASCKKLNKTLSTDNQEGFLNGLCVFLEMFPDNVVNRVFNIKYSLTIKCPCGKISDEQFDISPFIHINFRYTLETPEDFRNYIYTHQIPISGFKCEKCGEILNTYRDAKLKRIREIIIVTFDKVSKRKYFPIAFSFPETTQNVPFNYKLIATVDHFGLYHEILHTSFGHYTANILNSEDNNFYQCDDDVIKNTGNSIQNLNTHAAIYHLC